MIDDNLEYLMSSLPDLVFKYEGEERKKVFALLHHYAGEPNPPKGLVEILDEEAAKFLTESEIVLFKKISLVNIYREEFRNSKWNLLSQFAKFDFSLKEKIRQLRIARKENKSGSAGNENDFIISGNPLEEELQILQYQWDAVEEFAVNHFTDIDALVAYKIKLMILLRWWSFDADQGFDIFSDKTKVLEYGR